MTELKKALIFTVISLVFIGNFSQKSTAGVKDFICNLFSKQKAVEEDKQHMTAHVAKLPDSAFLIVENVDQEFVPETNYFKEISNEYEKSRIVTLTERAHPFYKHFTKDDLQNRIAYSWVRLKVDLHNIVTKHEMNKLGGNVSLSPRRIAQSIVVFMTENGSVVMLEPKQDGIHVNYTAIPWRNIFAGNGHTIKPNMDFVSDYTELSALEIGEVQHLSETSHIEPNKLKHTGRVVIAYWIESKEHPELGEELSMALDDLKSRTIIDTQILLLKKE